MKRIRHILPCVVLALAMGCGSKKAKGGAHFTGDCETVKTTVTASSPDHAELAFRMCQEKKLRAADVKCLESEKGAKGAQWCIDEAIKNRKAGL